MAYKDEKHAYEQLTEDMKKDDVPAVVLLRGKEEYLVDFYANSLISTYIREECRMLDLVTFVRDSVTVSDIIGSLETMPFMSQRKIVFLPEFFDEKGRLPRPLEKSQEDKKLLVQELSELNPETTLLIMTAANPADYKAEKALKENAIYKEVSKGGRKGTGRIYDFGPLTRRQLSGFIEKRLRAAGKQYRPGQLKSITQVGVQTFAGLLHLGLRNRQPVERHTVKHTLASNYGLVTIVLYLLKDGGHLIIQVPGVLRRTLQNLIEIFVSRIFYNIHKKTSI